MEPNQKTPIRNNSLSSDNITKPLNTNEVKDDPNYAESVAAMAMLDYQLTEKSSPEPKHLISKKIIWYLAISTVLSIASLLVYNFANRGKSDQSTQQIKELLESTKKVRELQNE